MKPSTIITWEDRLTRLSFALLLLATAYGIVVGAAISMYYDVTPNMGSLEDKLASIQLVLYLLAVIVSLSHLPLLGWDLKNRSWKQAAIRGLVFIGPLIIFLGTEGLISHFLWWAPTSETDRFHMLHHAVVAGVPLTLGYWVVLRRWWRPATISTPPSLSRRSWLLSGIVFAMVMVPVGIMAGLVSPIIFAVTEIIGLFALVVVWRVAG
jgi:hypothetical protein